MTYFLRTHDNTTLVDLDFRGNNDFSCLVLIRPFADMMLSMLRQGRTLDEFVIDMENLQELRGEWWEQAGRKDSSGVHKFCEGRLREIGRKWGLVFLVD